MKPNIDQPWTWVKHRPSLCETCIGSCCTMPVEVTFDDLVRLELASVDEKGRSRQRLFKRLRGEGFVLSYRQSTELFTLARQSNGACVFLNKLGRCTVYEKRPDVCRAFPAVGPKPGFCPHNRL